MTEKYKLIVGIEVHCELNTQSKMYCSCSTKNSELPNTNVCPICMGFPGTLPTLNKKAIYLAIKAGLATNCSINNFSKQDRKNYFYPDMPKAYQISQFDKPLCSNGYIVINQFENPKKIGIERIHIEEDAGKLIHLENQGSIIDFNRSGVGLIEIVSKPDISTPLEAKEYLQTLRNILVYCDISQCQMNLGQLRCDVNISVKNTETNKNYNRVEIKNINSFNFVAKAIEYEYKRQVEQIEKDEIINQETRKYDSNKNKTILMRKKEQTQDYMYFQEPDIPFIKINPKTIEKIKSEIPILPNEKIKIYVDKYNLSIYDAALIAEDKNIAKYYDEVISIGTDAKTAANLIIGEIFSIISKENCSSENIPIKPKRIFQLSTKLKDNSISYSTAKDLINRLWKDDFDVYEIIEKENLQQVNDTKLIKELLLELIEENPEAIKKYKEGKKRAIQSIIGQLMKRTKGKADPKLSNELLLDIVKEM